MPGVMNRLPHVVCEVGRRFTMAAYTEYVTVIPGNADLRDERHQIDIALCHRHDQRFSTDHFRMTGISCSGSMEGWFWKGCGQR
jgi:hypothetical protein